MGNSGLFCLLVWILILGFYFIPSIFAWMDRKRNAVAIFALNFSLGCCVVSCSPRSVPVNTRFDLQYCCPL